MERAVNNYDLKLTERYRSMRHPTTNVGGSTEVRTDGGEEDDSKDVVAGRYPHLTVNVAE